LVAFVPFLPFGGMTCAFSTPLWTPACTEQSLDERVDADLLMLVLADGARAVFQYKTELKRFVADQKSRVPGAQRNQRG